MSRHTTVLRRLLPGRTTLQIPTHTNRCAGYVFAVAVENCVNKTVKGASRRPHDKITTLSDLKSDNPDRDEGDIYQNGSLMSVWTKGFQAFDEFDSVEPGKMFIFPTGKPVADP